MPGQPQTADDSVGAIVRPMRADALRNRQRVLDAALAEFSQHGLDAQMEDVAERAGVGVGTLYRHFETKEALLEALVALRFAETLMATRAALEREDAWQAIGELLERHAEVWARDRLFAEMSGGPGTVPSVRPILDQLVACWAQLIARATAQGRLRSDFTVADVGPMMCGLAHAALNFPDESDRRRYLRIIRDGLRAPATSA
jgi:AcrR family transcriptional regulator